MRPVANPSIEMALMVLGGLAAQLATNLAFDTGLLHDALYGPMIGLLAFLSVDLKRRAKADSDTGALLRAMQRRLDELADSPRKVENGSSSTEPARSSPPRSQSK